MKVIVTLLILAGVVVGVFMFGVLGGSEEARVTSESDSGQARSVTEEELVSEPQTWQGETALADLHTLGTDIECTIAYDPPGQAETVEGTYFVSQGRVRGDFEMNVPDMGGSMVSSIIMRDDTVYSWSNIGGESYGVQFPMAVAENETKAPPEQPIPADAAVTYECVEWRAVDASIFEPPSDVLFQEYGQIIQAGMEYGTIYTEE